MEQLINSDSQPGTIEPGIDGSSPIVKKSHHRKPRTTRTTPSTDTTLDEKAEAGTPLVLDQSGVSVEPVNVDTLVPGAIKATENKNQLISATAIVLMTVIDGLVIGAFGEAAHMNQTEKTMIAAPLERVLAKFNLGNNTVLDKYLDPVLLAMGLMAWGMRISRLQVVQGKSTNIQQAIQQASVPTPAPAPIQEQSSNNGHIPAGAFSAVDIAAPASISDLFRSESL